MRRWNGTAEPLESRAGDVFTTMDGQMTVSGVFDYPNDGRRNDFEYSALQVTAATGRFTECWVQVWPVPHIVTQLNVTKGTAPKFLTEFENRLTRFVPYGVAFAAFMATGTSGEELPPQWGTTLQIGHNVAAQTRAASTTAR